MQVATATNHHHQQQFRNAEGARVQCDACGLWTLRDMWPIHLTRCLGLGPDHQPHFLDSPLTPLDAPIARHSHFGDTRSASSSIGSPNPDDSLNGHEANMSIDTPDTDDADVSSSLSQSQDRVAFDHDKAPAQSNSASSSQSKPKRSSAATQVLGNRRLGAQAKRAIMVADPLAKNVEANKVFCVPCNKYVKLSSLYGIGLWISHCASVHKRNTKEQEAMVDKALKDAEPEIEAELERLRHDPRVRAVRGQEVQCNACGAWAMCWDMHKCARTIGPRQTAVDNNADFDPSTGSGSRGASVAASVPEPIPALPPSRPVPVPVASTRPTAPPPIITSRPSTSNSASKPPPAAPSTPVASKPAAPTTPSTSTSTPTRSQTTTLLSNLTGFARRKVLEHDPLASNVEPTRVHCSPCERWITLQSGYAPQSWWSHCEMKHGRDWTTQAGMVSEALEVHSAEIAADNARLLADPHVRQIDGKRVQCNDCGRWTSTWETHLTNCPMASSSGVKRKRVDSTSIPVEEVKRVNRGTSESELSDDWDGASGATLV